MKKNFVVYLCLSGFCVSSPLSAENAADVVSSIPLDVESPLMEADMNEDKARVSKTPQKNIGVKHSKNSLSKGADLIAAVDQKPITERDLAMRVKLILVTSGIPVTDESMKMLREQVLKNMIEEYVQLGTASKYKVAASEKEVLASLKHMAKEAGMTMTQLEEMLKSNGIPLHYLRDRIKAQVSWINFARAAYAHTLHVSDKEVEKRLEAESNKEKEEQFLVYEIRIAADSPSQMPMAKAQADRLISELKKGANFQALAQQFSSSPTASKGGYVGWVTKSPDSSLHQKKPMNHWKRGKYPIRCRAITPIIFIYLPIESAQDKQRRGTFSFLIKKLLSLLQRDLNPKMILILQRI